MPTELALPNLMPDFMMPQNPFQVLTFIVAPAILTNSSSILSLATSNRFARVVDRSRALYEKLKHPETLAEFEKEHYQDQLRMIGRRSFLLVRALTCFYASVGAFASTALMATLGASGAYLHYEIATEIAIGISLVTGLSGVLGLAVGTGMLVIEMWLAQSFLRTEVDLTRKMLEKMA